MKKYLIASVVAIMAFAFAAFAASLTVTSTVVQAGETEDLQCSDTAHVTSWNYNPATGEVSGVDVELHVDHDCDGETMYVTVLDVNDDELDSGDVPLVGGTDTYTVDLADVDAESIITVRIGIVQE